MLKVTPDLNRPGALVVDLYDNASPNVCAMLQEYLQTLTDRYRYTQITPRRLEALTAAVYQQMDLWLEQGRIELAPGGWRCLP